MHLEYQNKIQKITGRLDFGRSWRPFGRGLGRSGPPFGRSWVPLGRFLDAQYRTFLTHWSKMVSRRPLGSILGGFWEGWGRLLGRFGPRFGRTYEFFNRDQTESLITDAQFMHESFYGVSQPPDECLWEVSGEFFRFLRPPR